MLRFHGDNTGSNPVGDANIRVARHPPPHHLCYHGESGTSEGQRGALRLNTEAFSNLVYSHALRPHSLIRSILDDLPILLP
jgi:hypothetical protein